MAIAEVRSISYWGCWKLSTSHAKPRAGRMTKIIFGWHVDYAIATKELKPTAWTRKRDCEFRCSIPDFKNGPTIFLGVMTEPASWVGLPAVE